MTTLDLIQEEASRAGKAVTESEAEHILWGHTGYPHFWPDTKKTPEENLRNQVREFFAVWVETGSWPPECGEE